MRTIHTDIAISAPAARVWDVLSATDKWADWNPFAKVVSGHFAGWWVDGGLPSREFADYLAERAKGGVGLFVIGATSLAWCGVVVGQARLFQTRQRAAFEDMARSAQYADARGTQADSSLVTPAVIGQLEIPRLKLSAMVAEGDDEDTLDVAVGHLPDTPLPWQAGNSALAGHRDTFFRALKGVRVGDEIRLASVRGEFRYRVARTLVVEPNDLSVLEPLPEPSLTLITCFPFSYVGNAPRRFIVQANRIGSRSS